MKNSTFKKQQGITLVEISIALIIAAVIAAAAFILFAQNNERAKARELANFAISAAADIKDTQGAKVTSATANDYLTGAQKIDVRVTSVDKEGTAPNVTGAKLIISGTTDAAAKSACDSLKTRIGDNASCTAGTKAATLTIVL